MNCVGHLNKLPFDSHDRHDHGNCWEIPELHTGLARWENHRFLDVSSSMGDAQRRLIL
jgi:hypothetical protein